jgi:murein DD-endopeptidase MepM/ murein hydrolase activator NlpD
VSALTFLAQPEIVALDATSAGLLAALGRQSLYAALALALALVAARLLRRAPARVHAALWALVLVRLLLPPGLSAPWSARSLLGIGALGGEAPAATAVVVEPAGLAPLPATRGVTTSPADPVPGAPVLPWSLLATAAWIAGVLTVAGRLAWRRRSFRRIAREAPPVTDPWVLTRFDAMRRELGIGRPVRLVSGAAAAPAFTLGVLRPVVHLPARFLRAGSPRTAVDAALAHELAHVAALDDLQLRLRGIAYALFFFHPAAWWASIRHAESRELAADERVVASGVLTPRAYGRGFLAALRLDSTHGRPGPSAALAAPALAADRRRLAMRMERILATQNPRGRFGRLAHLALIAAALLVLPMARAEMGAETSETAVDPTLDLAVPAPEPAAPAPEGGGLASLPTLPPPVMTSFAPPLAAAAPSPLAPAPAPAPAFMSPVPQARVTSPFGERWNPVKSSQDHHNGVDLAADEGTPVRAAGAGIVRVATTRYEEGADWGTVVVVEHADGYQTFHAHLGSLSVTPGQRVVRGDELGTVGATGRVTGPHLHFEVHKDGLPVDPKGLIDGC